jgi:hypothetical protein
MYEVIIICDNKAETPVPRKFDRLAAAFAWMQELVQNGFFRLELKTNI